MTTNRESKRILRTVKQYSPNGRHEAYKVEKFSPLPTQPDRWISIQTSLTKEAADAIANSGLPFPQCLSAHQPKRILSVTVKRIADYDADTSRLGEFSDTPNDYAIVNDNARGEYGGQFVKDLPCDCGHATWQHAREGDPRLESETRPDGEDWQIGQCYVADCDCEDFDRVEIERGREYRYFNPANIDKTISDEEQRKYAMQDYERMTDLNNDGWCFVGVRADARIQLNGDLVQKITSGGLWGIESDSGDYFKEVENEQLDELRDQLHAIGFSKRAIAASFRNVEREKQ